MKALFNLASKPYENLRPYYTAAWIAVILAGVLALLLVGQEREHRSETRSLTLQLNRFGTDLENIGREQRELEQWLRRPEVQEIRDRSVFLNSLILRKSLSWTRMFLDLEKILPAQAQVTAIQPRLNASREPELALTVTATDMVPLVELLKNLESSPQFGSPTVESQRLATDRATGSHVTLELRTQYRPSLAAEPSPAPAEESAPAKAENSSTLVDAAAVRLGSPQAVRPAPAGPPQAAEQEGSR